MTPRAVLQALGRVRLGAPPLFKETFRWTDRLFAVAAVRFIVWIGVVAITHAGIFTDPFNIADWMDDHQFVGWEEADRLTLLRYGQLPAWNPFWCGGSVGIPAPEDPFLSPDFVLRLIFGVAHGRRLAVLVLVVLGFEGMYRLCRKLDASAVGAVFAALVYGTCDRFAGFIHDGWVHFLGFELIPWVIFGLIAGVTSWRYSIVGALFFSWIVLAPGTYPTPFTLIAFAYVSIALFLYALLRRAPDPAPAGRPIGWWQRPWAAIWVSGAIIGVVSLGLTFGKLVPTLVWVRQFARTFTPVEVHDASALFSGMWPHYGVVVGIALLGVATVDPAAAIFCGGAVLAFALARGDYGPTAPFRLLKALPIVGQLRYPDRYMVLFLFFISVAAARGITRLEDAVPALTRRLWQGVHWARRRAAPELPRPVGWFAVGLAAFLAYRQMRPLTEEVLQPLRIRPHTMYPEPPARTYEQPFRQHRGNRRDGHIFPPINMGSLYCAVGNPLPESPLLRADLPQEEYPVDPSKATVMRKKWSPLAIELDVDAKEATTIYINQNWAPEWRSNVGTVKSVDKLLAIDVPAGRHLLVVEYKDRFLVFCILVSLATLGAILYVFGRDGVRWAKREWDGFEALPWLPAAPAPPAPPPPPPSGPAISAVTAPAEDLVVSEPAPPPSAPAPTASEPPPTAADDPGDSGSRSS